MVAVAGGLAAASPSASAQPVHIAALGCDAGVLLSSRQAPLSHVLQQLSQVMGFRLEYRADGNPAITHHGHHRAVDLMAALSHRANLIVRYAADRRCPGQLRIDTVWVLPGSPASGPMAAALPAASGRAASAAPVRSANVSPDPALQEHMHAHGLLPPAAPAGSAPGSSSH